MNEQRSTDRPSPWQPTRSWDEYAALGRELVRAAHREG
jgi:hypothetical protein